MRLLICTGIFPPAAGGPATYSKILAEELIKRGHEVRVITYSTPTLSPPISRSETGGDEEGVIRINRSRFKPWHYYKYYRAVKKYGRDADILYVQDPVSAGYPTYLAAKVLQKPYAVKVTGDYSWEQAMNRALTPELIEEFQSIKHHPWPINKIRDIQIRVCKAAETVITPSEYLKRIVMGWGVKEKRIQVIYNAVEPVPEIPRDQARKELGIAEDQFVILSLGRNVPWKGFDLLREAVAELSHSVIPVRRGGGIHSNLKLIILHDADRQTTNKYFRAADLFVLNTGYEGFSHTILEAMSAGLPVITSNVGGNPEVITSGQNGILIEYNNGEQLKGAILKLSRDLELRKRLAQNAEISLKKFSLENMIEKTERVLQNASLNA